jgi:hypothetical protein
MRWKFSLQESVIKCYLPNFTTYSSFVSAVMALPPIYVTHITSQCFSHQVLIIICIVFYLHSPISSIFFRIIFKETETAHK